MKFNDKIVLVGFFFIFILNFLYADKLRENRKNKNFPNKKFFINFKKYWCKKKFSKIIEYFDKRIFINLGKYKGRYYKDQVIGILQYYLKNQKIVKFEYLIKKMNTLKGVIKYEYILKDIGKYKKKILYIYLKGKKEIKEKSKEVIKYKIIAINEINYKDSNN